MFTLAEAVKAVLQSQKDSGKPLAIVLAGHNGSGKSTMWYRHLAPRFRIPLVNADRMMMSILPEIGSNERLPKWAAELRDKNTDWMKVAQAGVQAFVAQAMTKNVPFAMETVFSHWEVRADGTVESKIDLICDMQRAGYFVVLIFVGLTNSSLSVARVSTRVAAGGHGVPVKKLHSRFPKTQKAIGAAAEVADATIMADNSRTLRQAFTLCRIQLGNQEIYDRRNARLPTPPEVMKWLDIVKPRV